MKVGIGFVLELTSQEPAAHFCQLDSLRYHPHAALGRRSEDHLGAQETHQLAPLDAEGLGHGHDQRIALLGTYHCETDAGVAARCFDDGLPGLQFSRALGGLEDAKRKPILDRAQGVERLDLDIEICVWGGQPVYLDNRSIAHRFKNVCEPASHTCPPSELSNAASFRSP